MEHTLSLPVQFKWTKLSSLRRYLLDVLQSLYNSDVVQVNSPCSVPVLDGGAVFRDRQPLQELQQVVVVVIDDAVYGKMGGTKYKFTKMKSST